MAADIGRWMGALSDLEVLEREAKHPPLFKKLFQGKSVEQEALEIFAAAEKSKQQRTDLKNMIGMMYGHSKWEQLLKTEASIRKARKETLYLQRQRRQKFVEIVAWIFMALIGCGILFGFVMLLKAHTVNAQPDHVTCRLVGCEIIKKKRYCVYRGVKTQETVVLEPSEWFPREYQCKYDPDAPKPPSLQETLKAIRESQK